MLDISDVLVVAHHKLLKFAVEAEQRVEEICKVVLVIVRQHQQKQFLLFNVEINAVGYSVVHAGNHRVDKCLDPLVDWQAYSHSTGTVFHRIGVVHKVHERITRAKRLFFCKINR